MGKGSFSPRKNPPKALTVMLIPHAAGRPLKISLSWNFLWTLAVLFVGSLAWAGFIISRQLDYWSKSAETIILQRKTKVYAKEMLKAREALDSLKDVDEDLRGLLKMKSRKAVIENEKSQGGPTALDRKSLLARLQNKMTPFSETEFFEAMAFIQGQAQKRLESRKEILTFVSYERGKWRAAPKLWPTWGRITSRFGMRRHPITGKRDFHGGIDIANDKGTDVRAAAAGTVTLAGYTPGFGRLVVIDHGYGFITRYAHNSRIFVKKGQKVKRGSPIARMGSSGHSTGTHLHYEVLSDGKLINPLRYLK